MLVRECAKCFYRFAYYRAGPLVTLKTSTDNNAQAGVAGYAYRAATRLTNGVQSDWGVANLGAEPEQMDEASAKAKPDEPQAEAARAT